MMDRALFWGPIATLAAALPAAMRLSQGGVPFSDAWTGVAALLCVPVVCLVAAGTVARRELGALSAESRRRVAVGISIWAAICCPVDALLGSVLQSSTHHRALGGVTFAAMALGVATAAAFVAWRAVIVLGQVAGRRFAAVVGGVAVLAILLASTARAWPSFSHPARWCLVDAASAVVAMIAAVAVPMPNLGPRMTRPSGLALAVLVVAIGAWRLGSSGDLGAAIGARAPLASGIANAAGIAH
jgi:hypothetical protein